MPSDTRRGQFAPRDGHAAPHTPPMPRIAMVFTGGTISMRTAPSGAGNVPTMRGDDLLATVSGLEELASIESIDWGLVPASHLTFAQVLEIGRVLQRELGRDEIDGTVVVQGTDAIEETAFAWDLLPLPAKPVVVVGAMRSASEPEYDGPANIRNAVTAACEPRLGDQGVVVAMAGELHAADDVRKMHTYNFDAFGSPNAGRLGRVVAASVTLDRRRESHVTLAALPHRAALPVPVLHVVLDELPPPLPPEATGLVVAALGSGNTPPAYLDVARGAMRDGLPVVLATRAPSGGVRPGYAFPGGSSQWWEAGVIFAGTLDAPKARVLLALGVGAGASVDDIADLCRAYGGGRTEASAAG